MTDPVLGAAVLAHLDSQLASTRALLDIVLRQGAAVRRRDGVVVLACIDEISIEMAARSRLDEERSQLLGRAAGLMGVSPGDVTLGRLNSVLDPATAATATDRSAELRGLLDELSQQHRTNRALMRQELQFIDHLTRMAAGEPEGAYGRDGEGAARTAANVSHGGPRLQLLDMQA
jgi:hypothetical protein